MAFIYDLADTWAAAGTVFTGIKLNVTDSASAAGSLLMDLQIGGTSKVSVAKNGDVSLHNAQKLVIGTDFNLDHYLQLYASSRIYPGGNSIIAVGGISNRYAALGLGGLTLSSTDGLGWNSSGPWSLTGATPDRDLTLVRDAANTLAQRNGTNAQGFNIYNTYTDANNYERGFMRFASNTLQVGTEKGTTGTARALDFQTNGITRLNITADGSVRCLSGFLYNNANGVAGIWANFGGVGSNYIGNESSHTFSLRTVNVNRITVDTVGSVQIVTALTVATLPATPLVGMIARVTDSSSPTTGSTVAGGGAAAALCWYNGTDWKVIGV